MLAPLVAALLVVAPVAPSAVTAPAACHHDHTEAHLTVLNCAGRSVTGITTGDGNQVGRTVAAPPRAPSTLPLFVDPDTSAAQQVRDWEAEGRITDANALRRIADTAQPLWVGGTADDVETTVREYVDRAMAASARPLFVGYNITHRDCGAGYSDGGVTDAAEYRAWARAFAKGLRGSDAIVVLEPDAIPHQLQGGCGQDADERYGMLAAATEALTAAGAAVYLDAGHPGFTGDVDATADALRRSGVDKAAGFSLNVANFLSTEANTAYGTAISEKLGGTHFVIDTSRNGAPDEPSGWCNPPGRAIGAAPTYDTGNPLVDALLWIKRPGESDGDCGDGAPPAGDWFPQYALGLVEH